MRGPWECVPGCPGCCPRGAGAPLACSRSVHGTAYGHGRRESGAQPFTDTARHVINARHIRRGTVVQSCYCVLGDWARPLTIHWATGPVLSLVTNTSSVLKYMTLLIFFLHLTIRLFYKYLCK